MQKTGTIHSKMSFQMSTWTYTANSMYHKYKTIRPQNLLQLWIYNNLQIATAFWTYSNRFTTLIIYTTMSTKKVLSFLDRAAKQIRCWKDQQLIKARNIREAAWKRRFPLPSRNFKQTVKGGVCSSRLSLWEMLDYNGNFKYRKVFLVVGEMRHRILWKNIKLTLKFGEYT